MVENCDSSVRSTYSEHCELHYYRLRRSGTVAEPEYISGHCEIDGCEADATTNRAAIDGQKMYLCRLHYLRIQKRGDASFECRGENSPNWTGSEASSGAVHYRVRKARGPAASWSCVDCARPAEHWSDDHMDPNEKSDPEEGPYSLDIDHYFPRCVRCHKRFDLDYLARIEVAS
ncbi:hypothetical protein [Mycobacterium sp. SMC-4]|uniref:hypothetical protein n=1 Tax=Mycobacterium sp. SMC-4 TaxID=2857059 RepID=UPI0021B3598E|nr:hypothetical protein [Mycobacterium sp. SMC-4]UXA19503.1 hypothetical protein KXD98_07860 [Mycobacterium sp. SMC-4]